MLARSMKASVEDYRSEIISAGHLEAPHLHHREGVCLFVSFVCCSVLTVTTNQNLCGSCLGLGQLSMGNVNMNILGNFQVVDPADCCVV